jgi:hypothetical protein
MAHTGQPKLCRHALQQQLCLVVNPRGSSHFGVTRQYLSSTERARVRQLTIWVCTKRYAAQKNLSRPHPKAQPGTRVTSCRPLGSLRLQHSSGRRGAERPAASIALPQTSSLGHLRAPGRAFRPCDLQGDRQLVDPVRFR